MAHYSYKSSCNSDSYTAYLAFESKNPTSSPEPSSAVTAQVRKVSCINLAVVQCRPSFATIYPSRPHLPYTLGIMVF